MPNRNIPRTPGGTTNYTDNLVYDKYYPPVDMEVMNLRPGGWLTAIMVGKDTGEELYFELTDIDKIGLYAQFTVPHQLSCNGIWFEPIPNVNAAFPYVLIIPPHEAKLEVITVNRMQDFG